MAQAVSTVGRSKGFDSLPSTFLRSSQISLQSAPRPTQKARAPTVFPVTPRRKRRSTKPNGFTADAGGRIRNGPPTVQTRLRQLGREKGALSNCFSAKNHSPNPVSRKTPKEAGRQSKDDRRLCLSHRCRNRCSTLPNRAGSLNGPEVGLQRLPAARKERQEWRPRDSHGMQGGSGRWRGIAPDPALASASVSAVFSLHSLQFGRALASLNWNVTLLGLQSRTSVSSLFLLERGRTREGSLLCAPAPVSAYSRSPGTLRTALGDLVEVTGSYQDHSTYQAVHPTTY